MPGNSGANWLKAEVVMLGVGWGDREPGMGAGIQTGG